MTLYNQVRPELQKHGAEVLGISVDGVLELELRQIRPANISGTKSLVTGCAHVFLDLLPR
jgi:hypothetical protein